MRVLAFLILPIFAFGQTLDRAESLWRARDYQGANAQFAALVKQNPKNADYRVRWGRLLLERFNRADSMALFSEALTISPKHAGALLGLALVAEQSFDDKAAGFAQQALETDPNSVEARALLAKLKVEDSNYTDATAEANKALAVSPTALDAMTVLAAIDLLKDRPTPWLDRIGAINSRYGKAYETLAALFVLNRRYEEGIGYYRKAIALTPDLWSAHEQLGINLMRLGFEEEARQHLELGYANGQKDDATVNSLRLMDSYKNFVTFRDGNTVLRLHKKEAEVLRPYFESEMKRAMAVYEKKYEVKLDRPAQVEVYPDHEDFAVRTMGMPGLGALGVTFGYVVAMDSPSGRPPGSFHWASTMWHELSHVYVLTLTKHHVPRWFTEGMAVHEETAVAADWGDRLGPEVITAIKDKKLLPIADMDRGFIHPSFQAQVLVSYYQAGKVCDFISAKWGEHKLLDMVHDFAGTLSTAEVIRKDLGMEPEELDKQFLASVEAETKKTVDGYAEWRKKMKELSELSKAKKYDEAIRTGLAIRDLYPDYVEHANVYEFLSDAYLAKNDKLAAMAQLEHYSQIGGRSPEALKKLATLLVEDGRPRDAAKVLNRLNFIAPIDPELHQRLGDLWLAQGDLDGAVREFRAVIAEKPLDQAGSHFNLARAYKALQKAGDARDELLLALEAAPNFRPAQKMLLELSATPTN